MDIIAIDPSLTCTAVVINNLKFVYVARHVACTGSGCLKRWFREVAPNINLRLFDLKYVTDLTYTDHEILKFKRYSNIINHIVADIQANCGNIASAKLAIEGYSYSSSSGPLIDLVTFGTILRSSLFMAGIEDINIIPPQELKVKSAMLTYGWSKTRKNKYTNSDGKAAGSFTKHDMMKCLLDSDDHDEWTNKIGEHKDEILSLKSIPKPIEDINDATLLYRWLLSIGNI